LNVWRLVQKNVIDTLADLRKEKPVTAYLRITGTIKAFRDLPDTTRFNYPRKRLINAYTSLINGEHTKAFDRLKRISEGVIPTVGTNLSAKVAGENDE